VAKVVIAAGGTAGHVVPALAVAEALRALDAEVEFVGGERAEAELVPRAGYRFHALRVVGLERRSPLKAARAIALAVAAATRARRLLRRLEADVVLAGGGYVAGPVGLAAGSLRLPLALTEADSHLGFANRVLAPLARRVFLAFPLAGREGGKYVVTGRPVPAETGRVDRERARARFGIPPAEPCVLIFGGSLGARKLNEAAIEAFGEAAIEAFGEAAVEAFGEVSPCAVLHVAGHRDHDDLQRRLDELGAPQHYRLHAYIQPFAEALAAADLVVARAGGSVLELAAAGLPAILVPYPHATADHQASNARYMERAGAAAVVPDRELDGARLAREVGVLLGSPERLAEMAKAARDIARPDAAERIAGETLRLLGG